MQSRAYQIEMFEESLKGNRIICMSTGSGKTHIAKLRIEAELKKSPTKIVWFLAPNVALCQQQHAYLRTHLPAQGFKLITSLDNVEHWSTQDVWDAVLFNVEVVISTPQPLLDALSHGFIHMSRLSLLVFDEAHHCLKKAPMNMIMRTFYHPAEGEELAFDLPHILGLSASPVTSSKSTLEEIEWNLSATCRTPTRQLDEYRQFVHEPEFLVLPYAIPEPAPQPRILSRLRQVIDSIDINNDPYVLYLRRDGSDKAQDKLREMLSSRATATFKQLEALERRANEIHSQLGESACNRFVFECTMRLHDPNIKANRTLPTLKAQEWKYINTVLSQTRSDVVDLLDCKFVPDKLSTKAAVLIHLLVQEYALDIRCVIFVKQRSTAWALSQLLNQRRECQGKYSAEPFVGLSKVDRNLQLVDLVKLRDPSEVLANFESGKANIMVATSVMEEGVDIPALNLVIRYDDSENFRSFIQSRGRARHPHSKFVTLLGGGSNGSSYRSWKALEIEMKEKYADERRELARMEEEEEEDGSKVFRVESTGAILTLDSARQHLENFCAKLPKVAYVDEPRPDFILKRVPEGVSAKVILPTSVDTELRQFSGSLCKTEKMAKKNAAFEACLSLYEAGLVNDNLLPAVVPEIEEVTSIHIESKESMCQVRPRLNPWSEIASMCDLENAELVTLRVQISGGEQKISSVLLVLPRSFQTFLNIPLLWTPSSTLTAFVTPSEKDLPAYFEVRVAQKVTHHLMKTIYGRRIPIEDHIFGGYPCMVVPADYITSLERWLDDPLGMMSDDDKLTLECHLVRRQDHNIPYFSRKTATLVAVDEQAETKVQDKAEENSIESTSKSDDRESSSQNSDAVEVMRLPKRVDFLHPVASDKAHTSWESVPWSECSIENLPASYARMMLFIPSILHIVGIGLVAQNAVDTLLSPVMFKDIKHIMTALTASAAHEFMNYQSLEFLGDSLLKYYTSFQLFANFPKWHEGYLSRKKDSIVGNARLCRAALDVGLDRFIHTEPFAGAQWKVQTNARLRSQAGDQTGRKVSTKVLADVVEALIGAAYVDGTDMRMKELQSLACIRLFVPELSWESVQDNITRCQYPQLPEDIFASHFDTVEVMIGYHFENGMLLAEALTHPSAIDKFCSYQRLEFLGDAVLDHVVVTSIFRTTGEKLKPPAMHLIRTATVNAELLGFLCLETTAEMERLDVSTDDLTRESTITPCTERKYLCQFMSASGNAIMIAQQACIERHRALRDQINEAIQHGTSYPWSPLIRLRADKFFSDIIESILGAIYLDSKGSIDACRRFLDKVGLLAYLERLIREPNLEIMHPKEKLGVVSGTAKIKYEASWYHGEDGQERCRANVVLDGEVFAVSDDAFTRLEAETRAAELAVAKLASEKRLLCEAGGE